jgi:peptidoglycan/xylan/chitin deacetylase (PgdA/CDA1 family)
MNLENVRTRVLSRVQRSAAHRLARRPFTVDLPAPIVSFTFDDFPRSALLTGGAILNRFDVTGTYFASFGLMGTRAPTGEIFVAEDLAVLRQQGHELGCHTFSHSHSWETAPAEYERSIVRNREALQAFVPGASFRTFSYPISPPRPQSKRRAGERFLCCRGGGQTYMAGEGDLNYLASFFLEKSRDDLDAVAAVIEQNRRARGWLVLATHDVDDHPTPYGCTPAFFEAVVRRVIESGATVLPVAAACEAVQGHHAHHPVGVSSESVRMSRGHASVA